MILGTVPYMAPEQVEGKEADAQRPLGARGRALRDADWLARVCWRIAGAAAVDDHLLFLRGRTLMTQPLDVQQKRLTGEPGALLDEIGATTTGYPSFSVSATGTLAYSNPWPTNGELKWFDRHGQPIGDQVAPLGDYVDFALSPDQTRLPLTRVDPQVSFVPRSTHGACHSLRAPRHNPY